MKLNARPHQPVVLMLLTNAYDPDPRVRQEALSLIGMGIRVRLLAWDRDLKSPERDVIEGVEVRRIFLRSTHGRGTIQLVFYAWLFCKMLVSGLTTPFDAVHCHDLDTLPLGYILARLKRKPLIYDAHESFPDMLEGSVHPAVRRGLVHMENLLIRRVDLLITVGEKLRRHFAERGARYSVVVGNWKRLEEFSRTPEQRLELRRRLGIPDAAVVVVSIGQLFRDRKIEELLAALERHPETYLIIGGRGALEETVRAAAARNPRIRYIGFVRAADIPSYTCAGDIVYYGFDPENPNARFSAPNKLFEALAAGKPLITGDFGEIGEVARTAVCGIVLPAYSADTVSAALSSLEDPQTRSALGSNANRLARLSLNWEKGEDTLRREYGRLLHADLGQKPLPENNYWSMGATARPNPPAE